MRGLRIEEWSRPSSSPRQNDRGTRGSARLIVIFVVGDGGFVRAAAAKLNRWVVGIHNSLDPRTAKKVKKLPERLIEAQKNKFWGAE